MPVLGSCKSFHRYCTCFFGYKNTGERLVLAMVCIDCTVQCVRARKVCKEWELLLCWQVREIRSN